jgi:hypothetical protein
MTKIVMYNCSRLDVEFKPLEIQLMFVIPLSFLNEDNIFSNDQNSDVQLLKIRCGIKAFRYSAAFCHSTFPFLMKIIFFLMTKIVMYNCSRLDVEFKPLDIQLMFVIPLFAFLMKVIFF